MNGFNIGHNTPQQATHGTWYPGTQVGPYSMEQTGTGINGYNQGEWARSHGSNREVEFVNNTAIHSHLDVSKEDIDEAFSMVNPHEFVFVKRDRSKDGNPSRFYHMLSLSELNLLLWNMRKSPLFKLGSSVRDLYAPFGVFVSAANMKVGDRRNKKNNTYVIATANTTRCINYWRYAHEKVEGVDRVYPPNDHCGRHLWFVLRRRKVPAEYMEKVHTVRTSHTETSSSHYTTTTSVSRSHSDSDSDGDSKQSSTLFSGSESDSESHDTAFQRNTAARTVAGDRRGRFDHLKLAYQLAQKTPPSQNIPPYHPGYVTMMELARAPRIHDNLPEVDFYWQYEPVATYDKEEPDMTMYIDKGGVGACIYIGQTWAINRQSSGVNNDLAMEKSFMHPKVRSQIEDGFLGAQTFELFEKIHCPGLN